MRDLSEGASRIDARVREAAFQWYLDNGVFSVDANGRVWRLKAVARNKHGEFVKPCEAALADTTFSSNGYRRVFMTWWGQRFTVAAHRVVLAIVRGIHMDENEVIHHKNSDRTDNRPWNLEVCSPQENQQYITWAEWLNCESALDAEFTAFFLRRSVLDTGLHVVDAARRFGVPVSVAQAVVDGSIFPDL